MFAFSASVTLIADLALLPSSLSFWKHASDSSIPVTDDKNAEFQHGTLATLLSNDERMCKICYLAIVNTQHAVGVVLV